jgi:hypothetical protein
MSSLAKNVAQSLQYLVDPFIGDSIVDCLTTSTRWPARYFAPDALRHYYMRSLSSRELGFGVRAYFRTV